MYRAISLLNEFRQEPASVVNERICCVNAAIERVLQTYGGLVKERDIRAQIDLYPDRPPVFGDIRKLECVFSNLVLNAIEAMDEQQTERCLSVKTYFDSSRCLVRITIADSGPGISIETLPRIFDSFFTTKPQGTGLGLAICRAIVFKHNGWIEARNHPEGGAAFEVYLPAVAEPAVVSAPGAFRT